MNNRSPNFAWITVIDMVAVLSILVETVLPWLSVSEIGHRRMPTEIRIVLLNFLPFVALFLYLVARTVKIANRLFGEACLVVWIRRNRFYGLLLTLALILGVSAAIQADSRFVYVVFGCSVVFLVLVAFGVMRIIEMRRVAPSR